MLCAIAAPPLNGNQFESLFDKEDLAVYILSEKSGEEFCYNRERTFRRFTACSTFKIPNSMIALDLGIVSNKDQVFKYDPEKHSNRNRKSADYNRDQTLESAFKISAVWTYQEIAKIAGKERYKDYLKQFDYGNQDLSAGVETFWLSSLKISAQEQVKFLKKFYNNELKLKEDITETVKEMMLIADTEHYKLYGKTGTQLPELGNWMGWIVGFVESKNDVFYFAINLHSRSYKELSSKRLEILNTCIENLEIETNKGNE